MIDERHKILGLSIKGARRLLVGSLVVNFLIIGAVFGLGMQAGEKRSERPQRIGGAFSQIVQLVGEEQRDAVRAILKDRGQLLRQVRRDRIENWREIAAILDSETFEEDRLSAALFAHSDQHNEGRKAAYAPLVQALSMMNAEERSQIAKKVRDFADSRSRKR